jgi:protein-tyrosine phosphatase
MADAIFRNQVTQAGLADLFEIDSAGTGGWHAGEPPHRGTQKVLREHGINYSHRARQVADEDFDTYDYIVALDSSNLADLRAISHGYRGKLARLLDYVPNSSRTDVPDPYYTGRFDEVYDLILNGCQALLNDIVTSHHLHAV